MLQNSKEIGGINVTILLPFYKEAIFLAVKCLSAEDLISAGKIIIKTIQRNVVYTHIVHGFS